MTAVEWLQSGLELIMSHEEQMQAIGLFEQAKEMEEQEKIEFACKVAELSADKYIQGKTTEQIAEELIKQQR